MRPNYLLIVLAFAFAQDPATAQPPQQNAETTAAETSDEPQAGEEREEFYRKRIAALQDRIREQNQQIRQLATTLAAVRQTIDKIKDAVIDVLRTFPGERRNLLKRIEALESGPEKLELGMSPPDIDKALAAKGQRIARQGQYEKWQWDAPGQRYIVTFKNDQAIKIETPTPGR